MKTQYIYIHDHHVIYRGDTLPPMAVSLGHEMWNCFKGYWHDERPNGEDY